MQFAGQRTDMDLNLLGEQDNFLIKLTPDVLPDPEAILITGITPQQTISEGINEAEFLKYFSKNIFNPDTIMVGFNNVRFDDEFMRYTFWRNFYDSYEWQWRDGCSRWDILDVARATRALRPEGIHWPFASDGKPINRLEYLTKINNLEHSSAHSADSDVTAVIEIARLIKLKQPRIFDYLLNIRSKDKVAALVNAGDPFIYTSGRYSAHQLHTTAVVKLADCPNRGGAIVYDLRLDPDKFINLSPAALAELWSARGKDAAYFPVKSLIFNKCPAIAPLSVLDKSSANRLQIDKATAKIYRDKIDRAAGFRESIVKAYELIKKSYQTNLVPNLLTVDEQLYNGFINDEDKIKTSMVRVAGPTELSKLDIKFNDERLNYLLPLYKARNYPKILSSEERAEWEKFRKLKLLSGDESSKLARYFNKLNELGSNPKLSDDKKYLLEELSLYGQSIMPDDQLVT